MIKQLWTKNKILFEIVIAALLPLLFYLPVFWGKTFGFECAAGVMGTNPPYQQTVLLPNLYCASVIDSGAYVWQHPAHWLEVSRQLLNLKMAAWSQNIGIGFPLLANFQSTVFYLPLIPFILLFELFNRNLLFLDLFFVFRYIIASVGMFLFLKSLHVNKELSWLAALIFFSSGYFILIPNISHLSVDILLPWIAWGFTELFISGKKKWIGISAIILGLSMLGGMPESSIFILFFSGIYILFLTTFYIKNKKIKLLYYGVITVILGLGIGAIIYLPGLELISNGISSHHAGANQKYADWRNIIFFVMPEIFAGNNVYQFTSKINFPIMSWNYIGVFVSYLYLISAGFLFNISKKIKTNFKLIFFMFFWILSFVLLLQQYGIVRFYIFEQLPVFKETTYAKYSATLINFSMLTSIILFLEYILKKISKKILLFWALATGLIIYVNYFYLNIIVDNYFIKTYFGILSANVFYALSIISIITFLLVFVKSYKLKIGLLFLIVFIEFYIYFPKAGNQLRKDSFKQPPAISYLLEKNYKEFRILGLNNILYPNLSTAYDLNDMRMIDALWINRYYQYMKNFFAEPEAFRISGIRENTATQSANILDNPYFDMLSVKYILTFNKIESEIINNKLIEEILKQNPKMSNLGKTIFDINKNPKKVLFEHAPGKVSTLIKKPEGADYLTVFPALSPSLFDKKNGDGVKFIARVYIDKALIDSQEIVIDASNKKSDKKWFTMKLGPFPNTKLSYYFELELITDQLKNNANDWSGWGGFIWNNEIDKTKNKYKLVYDHEMKIYENQDYIPRIHFIDQKICISSYEPTDKYRPIIDLMKLHKNDITKTAVVDGVNCNSIKYDSSKIMIFNQTFDDNKTVFTYTSSKKQYGVLSDAYYPGWNIYINGKKGKIDPVNLTFRGFELPEGKNIIVEFKYEPLPIKIGAIISVACVLISLIMIFRRGRKRRQLNI